MQAPGPGVFSTLCLYSLEEGSARVILRAPGRIEAPNLFPDGSAALVNAGGALFRVPLEKPALIPFPVAGITRCNNDHGFSPKGDVLAFSAHHRGLGAEIYRMDLAAGTPPQRLDLPPRSWWHGFSPDGRAIVYAAAREGARVRIALWQGGAEQILTGEEGHADGPEFSADGRRIYFNCDRGGHAQIWVMDRDGSNQRRLFADDRVNWFPHPSPDGRHLIYLSYPPGTEGHPADLPVRLMLCDPEGRNHRCLAEFTGGQGTMNVPNWSADGRHFAFVRHDPDGGDAGIV